MLIVPTEKQFDWQHAPFVLIALVLANILVFLLYQSNDGQKAAAAIAPMVELGYVDKEWPLYQSYLDQQQRNDELLDARSWYRQGDQYQLAQSLLLDHGYYNQLQRSARSEFDYDFYLGWKEQRASLQATFDSMSAFAFGLRSTDVSVTTLLTHQFLHGGLMHLVGNMVFLIVFGFAVEAAIGHLRFLLFYLAGGMLAGLAQVVTSLGSDVPLVGASGAISAVMAMYLAVFRLRKIEFFYWILFFVGYFRAPALLILPFYIAEQVYNYYTATDSNVAFMAHAGGFLAGGLFIGVALLFDRNMLNQEYIEQNQLVSPRLQSLAAIYKAIEAFRFDYALKLTNALIEREGIDFELALIRFNLDKIKKGTHFPLSFRTLMTLKGLNPAELQVVHKFWLATDEAVVLLPKDEQLKLAFQFTGLTDLSGAEKILAHLFETGYKPSELGLLAAKLANRFAERRDQGKSLKYQEMGQKLNRDGRHGIV